MGSGYPRLALLPALLALAWPANAWADNCSLTLLNSVPLTVVDNIAWVPASVGNKEDLFQIDTAAPDNQMGKDSAKAFGLTAVDFTPAGNDGGAGGFSMGQLAGTGIGGAQIGRSVFGSVGGGTVGNAVAITNARGVVFHSAAEARPFTLGAMRTDRVQFVVTDLPQPGNGGILSADFFHKYDVDLNFQAHRLNMFAADHCKGQVLYWRAPGVAALPFHYQNGHIVVRVTLDGREMDALIDTGSRRTEMEFDDPDSFFYLRSNSAGVMREVSGENAYNYSVLSFGTVAIFHPHVVLTHEGMGGGFSGPQTGTLLRNFNHAGLQPALTIGTDLLKMLHIYIAFNERMLYVAQGPELPEGDAKALPVVAVAPARP